MATLGHVRGRGPATSREESRSDDPAPHLLPVTRIMDKFTKYPYLYGKESEL